MGRRWYVARTEPRAEYLAADALTKDSFDIFFPRVKTPHPRFSHDDSPLFPGYIFIRLDPEAQGWPTFRLIHRILGWVGFDGRVPSVPNEVVAELADRVEELNDSHGIWRNFQSGQKVRVVSGGIEEIGEIVREAKSPQSRATVLLQFLGRLVPAEVPWENLWPLEETLIEPPRHPRRTRGRGRWIPGTGPRSTVAA